MKAGIVLLLAFGELAHGQPPTIIPNRTPRKAESSEQLAQQVIELTNRERVKHGLPPLKRQDKLTDAANWMASDMATKGYFDHTDRQGRSIDRRLPDFGYTPYRAIGENIAAGQPSPASVVTGWLNSPGHRANLLGADFREIGVGYSLRPNSAYKRYWVQDFGTQPDVFPIIINNEAGITRSPNVKLYLYGAGWARRMRLSNDGGVWTAWQPFQTTLDWTLAPGAGRHIVAVQLSDGDSTRRAEDTIETRQ